MASEEALSPDHRELVAAARSARATAYAPYSGFRVGAAALGASGRVYLGCNVENASYPVTVCAERAAVAAAVVAGEERISAVAVAGGADGAPESDDVTPCGLCRQFMAEFGGGLHVVHRRHGAWVARPIEELLPDTFSLGDRAGRGHRHTIPEGWSESAPDLEVTAGTSGSAPGVLRVERVERPGVARLQDLAEREREVFGHTGLRFEDLAVIARAGAVFIASVDGRMVGSCQLLRLYDDPGSAWLVGFYVLPAARGRGWGRRFLTTVAAEAGSAGLRRLLLTVGPENRPALDLYLSFGFRVAEVIADFYGPGEERLLLSCALGGAGMGGAGMGGADMESTGRAGAGAPCDGAPGDRP